MNVIEFPPKTTNAAAPSSDSEYFCTRCLHDQFKLDPGGSVHCGKCGVLVSNLLVVPAGLIRRP